MSKLNRAKIVLAYLGSVYEDPKILKEISDSIEILNGRTEKCDTLRVSDILKELTHYYEDIDMVNSLNLAAIKIRRYDRTLA